MDKKPPEWYALRNEKVFEWLSGNSDAINLLLAVNQIIETWDDLIDKDRQLSDERVNLAFYNALVTVPNNNFYIEHRQYLTPIIIQAINTWLDANKLERGDVNDRAIAYTLRFMGIQLIQALVFLTGGVEKLRKHSIEMWRFLVAEQDDAMEWIKETRP